MKVKQIISAQLRVKHPDPILIIRKLTSYGYVIRNIEQIDEITTDLWVDLKDYKHVRLMLDNWDIAYELNDRAYLDSPLKNILKRSALFTVVMILTLITFLLQGRILFVEILGNDIVPESLILDEVNENGIYFGVRNADIRSESIKNTLLEKIPELEWVGVNTTGCVATVCVREKVSINKSNSKFAVSSLIASTEGIVSACSVNKGTLLCKEGQTVQSGQLLISGYTDCGMVLKATMADGEVYANTLRNLTGVIPLEFSETKNQKKTIRRFGIRIGKKLINFDNNSGIYSGSCDKILKEKFLVLPGNFVLPFSVVIEEITIYDGVCNFSLDNASDTLYTYCKQYLQSQMVAGSIENEQFDIQKLEDCTILTGNCLCTEMIGRRKNEDIFTRGN